MMRHDRMKFGQAILLLTGAFLFSGAQTAFSAVDIWEETDPDWGQELHVVVSFGEIGSGGAYVDTEIRIVGVPGEPGSYDIYTRDKNVRLAQYRGRYDVPNLVVITRYGDDDVIIDSLSISGLVLVNTSRGDDNIMFKGHLNITTESLSVGMGSGNDQLTIESFDVANGMVLYNDGSQPGAKIVELGGENSYSGGCGIRYYGGLGADTFRMHGNVTIDGSLIVRTGHFVFEGVAVREWYDNADDTVELNGSVHVSTYTDIRTFGGNDDVRIRTDNGDNYFTWGLFIDTAAGDDFVWLGALTSSLNGPWPFVNEVFGGLDVKLGAGDDILLYADTTPDTGLLDGGADYDSLLVHGNKRQVLSGINVVNFEE